VPPSHALGVVPFACLLLSPPLLPRRLRRPGWLTLPRDRSSLLTPPPKKKKQSQQLHAKQPLRGGSADHVAGPVDALLSCTVDSADCFDCFDYFDCLDC
jgi:hypothetical protein